MVDDDHSLLHSSAPGVLHPLMCCQLANASFPVCVGRGSGRSFCETGNPADLMCVSVCSGGPNVVAV